jgi:hypothetical protein
MRTGTSTIRNQNNSLGKNHIFTGQPMNQQTIEITNEVRLIIQLRII